VTIVVVASFMASSFLSWWFRDDALHNPSFHSLIF